MKKKKSVKNKYFFRRILAILVIILIIIFFGRIVGKLREKNKYKELTILMNNEFIKVNNEVIIDDNKNIYFSKDDIQSIFDETIYYNEAEKELITTYNKHIALLKVDENYMLVNDSNIELKGILQEINGKIYIPITDLEIVYDIETEYSEKSNRIIIDSISKQKVQATINKKIKVKAKKGLFRKKIEKLSEGEKVVVIDTSGNYKKIRTSLGNIGFVKNKRISDETILREDMNEEKKTIKVFKQYSNISGIYDNTTIDENNFNVVIPTFFYLDKNLKILDKTTSGTAVYANYTKWVEENKLNILPTVSNNVAVSSSLLTYSQRNQVINSLYEQIIKYQYKGININFETIDDLNSLYRFIIELTPKFKESGLIVSVTLNKNLDKNKLEKIVDYVIE